MRCVRCAKDQGASSDRAEYKRLGAEGARVSCPTRLPSAARCAPLEDGVVARSGTTATAPIRTSPPRRLHDASSGASLCHLGGGALSPHLLLTTSRGLDSRAPRRMGDLARKTIYPLPESSKGRFGSARHCSWAPATALTGRIWSQLRSGAGRRAQAGHVHLFSTWIMK